MSPIKEAIEALEGFVAHGTCLDEIDMAKGRAALAALCAMPAEPVAWFDVHRLVGDGLIWNEPYCKANGINIPALHSLWLGKAENVPPAWMPVYTTPPPAPVLSDAWQPIETAPRDGSVFVAARFVEGEEPDPDFDYELGHYKPLVFDRYEEAGDNLFRKVPEQVYDWHGFNNFGRMTHWQPLPSPPIEQAIGRASRGAK